jgi:hypothetical protein
MLNPLYYAYSFGSSTPGATSYPLVSVCDAVVVGANFDCANPAILNNVLI